MGDSTGRHRSAGHDVRASGRTRLARPAEAERRLFDGTRRGRWSTGRIAGHRRRRRSIRPACRRAGAIRFRSCPRVTCSTRSAMHDGSDCAPWTLAIRSRACFPRVGRYDEPREIVDIDARAGRVLVVGKAGGLFRADAAALLAPEADPLPLARTAVAGALNADGRWVLATEEQELVFEGGAARASTLSRVWPNGIVGVAKT